MLKISTDPFKTFHPSLVYKWGLTSFIDHGKNLYNSGSPSVIFLCERPRKDGHGTTIITGASKVKLKGYPELERAINQGRADRFTSNEIDEIQEKIEKNRDAVKSVLRTDEFRQAMT